MRDSLYGQTMAGYQKSRAAEKKLNVVEILPYSAKSVDLTPVVLRLKSANVDIVLQTSYQNDTVLFFRQMKDQGSSPRRSSARAAAIRCATPCWRWARTIWKAPSTSTSPSTRPIQGRAGMEEFLKKYKAKYNTDPRSGHSLANYMGARACSSMPSRPPRT